MIAEAIKSALLDWGVVVVPDLGTFWSEESGAEVSPSGNIIKPPHVSISFSSSEDDIEMYSLVTFISKSEDLDEDEVAIQVSMFVANLQQRLDDGEIAPIGDLGYFLTDESGETSFRQRSESNIEPDSFGLPKITATPLMENDIHEEEEEYSDLENDIEEKSSKPVWLYVSIPVILLLTAVGYFLLKPSAPVVVNKGQETEQEEVIEEVTIQEGDNEVDVKETTIDIKKVNDDIQEVEVKEEVFVEEETGKPGHADGHYHIVISSFNNQKQANAAVKQAKKKGFDDVGVIVSKGKYRVAIKGYQSHKDAKADLESTQKAFKGAWVWRY
ncbi:SPOR domain-containing protein [Flammeovirga kamogawensis]|uniref:SPOR domain-containing protein n=1 Tax=Flammeovirga kamogawensis TaxID=373891 RepID=A0ABX8GWH0_9BACT|nr:SPOR domain-containing protein [Flammeovirga kamogawensis]MBB6460523.1 hypothetical protein [Flammeovirga kamogawensis]QWG07886.1 SPOR domain-containing protein [Flammeovirga kamogawensis]TRX69692.1 SPOR domain-containing protein [Flammeovirga kamogawensis]